MPSAGLEPATPSLGRRRSGPLSYEGLRPAARIGEVIIDIRRSGRSSARLECTVRDREVGGSNPLAPISHSHPESSRFSVRFRVLASRAIGMTGRTLIAMLTFAGIVVAVMWFFVLPALTTFRPTLP